MAQTSIAPPAQSSGAVNAQTLQNPTQMAHPPYTQGTMVQRPMYLANGAQTSNSQASPSGQQSAIRPQQPITALPLQGSTPTPSQPSGGVQQSNMQAGLQYPGLQSLQQQNVGLQQQMHMSGQHPGMQGLVRTPMVAMSHHGTPGTDGAGGTPRPAAHLQVRRLSGKENQDRVVILCILRIPAFLTAC